jgi:LysM repeat protein
MKTVVKIMLSLCLLSAIFAFVPVNSPQDIAWTTRIENYVRHTVQTGDTLEMLAKIYGTTVIRIVSRNRIAPNTVLVEGQKLIIPVSAYKEKMII